jgi:hypothetical protein
MYESAEAFTEAARSVMVVEEEEEDEEEGVPLLFFANEALEAAAFALFFSWTIRACSAACCTEAGGLGPWGITLVLASEDDKDMRRLSTDDDDDESPPLLPPPTPSLELLLLLLLPRDVTAARIVAKEEE